MIEVQAVTGSAKSNTELNTINVFGPSETGLPSLYGIEISCYSMHVLYQSISYVKTTSNEIC